MTIKLAVKKQIPKSEDIVEIMRNVYDMLGETDKHKEVFYAIGLTCRNTIKVIELITFGTIDKSFPYKREILRIALLKDCKNVIVCHNHPAGSIEPSREDNNFTSELKDACQACEIALLDHIILTADKYFSYADEARL